ncbi:Holliday junction endonuclease RuvC [Breznakibacter xylanolyticus]|uniref:Crossover junction endodeoxyribonuclease RuvC n=1 Tax=Breznakibacter xylanolyticus TaxID=990 RepID=A0A2W7NZW2_9BACT|nr:crossover junction endodeoxyribonuclease RuvC [Breznakibacter xylanolyticus]PZX16752.1 Holliday junction endonuclease RuvC [Breznakibacter xylanolyticus]
MAETTDKIIIGIDPGTTVMGYGVIQVVGKTPKLLALGVLELHKYSDHYLKLRKIFERITQLVETYSPDEMAIEAPFFGKNVQSMLKLGRAQGVAMAAALVKNIPIFEYAPLRVKQAITGSGAASKEQVAAMLQQILNFSDLPKYLDATDGLGVALCHHFQNQQVIGGEGAKSWKEFISKNPQKVTTRRHKL